MGELLHTHLEISLTFCVKINTDPLTPVPEADPGEIAYLARQQRLLEALLKDSKGLERVLIDKSIREIADQDDGWWQELLLETSWREDPQYEEGGLFLSAITTLSDGDKKQWANIMKERIFLDNTGDLENCLNAALSDVAIATSTHETPDLGSSKPVPAVDSSFKIYAASQRHHKRKKKKR